MRRSRTARQYLSAPGRRGRLGLSALLLLGLVWWLSTYGVAGGQSSSFQEATTVLAVEVPVQVIKDGQPVRGLTAENFEVFEGRQRQQIIDFDVIDLAEISPEEALSPGSEFHPAARRRFLLFFDLSFSDPAAVTKARRAAHELVLQGLHPLDLVAVATYSEAGGASLVLGFTTDRQQLQLALAGLGLQDPLGSRVDPLRIMLADVDPYQRGRFTSVDPVPEYFGLSGLSRDFDTIFMEQLRDQSAATVRADRDTARNQMLALNASMAELAAQLRSVNGRKHLVYFSEGFDSSVVLGIENADRAAEINRAAERGEFWLVDSDERYGSSASQSSLMDMLDEFKRADCSIQAVDIGGMRTGGGDVESLSSNRIETQVRGLGEEGLYVMANETGGDLYRNYANLSEAMDDMLDRTSVTYLLVLQPREVRLDGAYHPLKVKLKKGPKGARVIHRPGYYADVPFGAMNPETRRLNTADLMSSGQQGGPVASTLLAAPFKADDERAYVMTMLEVMGYPLVGSQTEGKVPVEIYLYAFDEGGFARDFLTQGIVLDLDKVGQQLLNSGFKFVGHMDLEPGEYSIRAVVRHGLSGASGVTVAEVEVPSYSGSEPSLLPPFFIESEGAWVVGWEQRKGGEEPVYPLRLREKRLIPAGQPILPRAQEVPLLLVAHNLADAVTAKAWVQTEDGSRVADAELSLGDRFDTDVAGVDRVWASIRTGNVAPGSYDLVVALTDPATGATAENSIPVYVQ